nr:MAG TPA: hypothetical protein [Caudoviricetes sp.]
MSNRPTGELRLSSFIFIPQFIIAAHYSEGMRK